MDVTVIVSQLDASKKAIDKMAKQMADRLEAIQLGRK